MGVIVYGFFYFFIFIIIKEYDIFIISNCFNSFFSLFVELLKIFFSRINSSVIDEINDNYLIKFLLIFQFNSLFILKSKFRKLLKSLFSNFLFSIIFFIQIDL